MLDLSKGKLLECLSWQEDRCDVLFWRFPDGDHGIKNGADLIVQEFQVAQFVYLGECGDMFGPGNHKLTTDNIPILTRLKSWKYDSGAPFKSDLYFFSTQLFKGNKWNSQNPIMMWDDNLEIVRFRAMGFYDFRITDPSLFMKRVSGSNENLYLDQFSNLMCAQIVSVFNDALVISNIPMVDVVIRSKELGEALLPLINPVLIAKYGIEISSFTVENVSIPPALREVIDRNIRTGIEASLNDYVKYQIIEPPKSNQNSVKGLSTEVAIGLSIAQKVMKLMGVEEFRSDFKFSLFDEK